jgi:hypothetical protein
MNTTEFTSLNLELSAASGEFYVWEPPQRGIAVHLHHDVIDRLGNEVMRGFAMVPRRGAEVGGILLGRVEKGIPRVVRILDFLPVACDHAGGPSYQIGDAERRRFTDTLKRAGATAVGFYRSQTREGFALAEQDIDLFNQMFGDPAHVILLVKPFAGRASIGAFYFREGQLIRPESYLEFPFRRRDVGGQDPEAAPPAEPTSKDLDEARSDHMQPEIAKMAAAISAAEAPAVPEPNAAAEIKPGPPSKFRAGWVWIPLSFIFLLLGVVLGFQAAISVRPKQPSGPPPGAYALGLTATPSGQSLHVRWDRSAPAILTGKRGTLLISDTAAGKDQPVDLDPSQLQNGSVMYSNLGNFVKFRLEVFTSDKGSVTESLEVHAAQPESRASQ